MQNTLKALTVGTAIALASVPAFAQDSFVGLTWGETSNNMDRSGSLTGNPLARSLDSTINNESTWGVRSGVQDDTGRMYLNYEYISGTGNGYKLRQQNLLGSYDLFMPIADSTRLFGGVTAGLVKLEQDSPGFHRDSDLGLAGGLQAGILHQFDAPVSLEAGYRYLRTRSEEHTSELQSRPHPSFPTRRSSDLLGSYDLFMPIADSTRLFGGVTAGLVKLEQDSPGFHRDSDLGLAGGLQAGILHQFDAPVSLEAGYRYLRTTADVSLNARSGAVGGSADLKSSEQLYLGLNYHF